MKNNIYLKLSGVSLEELSEINSDIDFIEKQPTFKNYSWIQGKKVVPKFRNIYVKHEKNNSDLINYHVLDHGKVRGSLRSETIVGEKRYTSTEIRELIRKNN